MKKNIEKILTKIKENTKKFKNKINSNKDIKRIKSIYNKYTQKIVDLYKKYKKELENTLILISYIFIYYSFVVLIVNSGIYLWYQGFNLMVLLSMLFYIGLFIYTLSFKFKSPYKILAMVMIIEILI